MNAPIGICHGWACPRMTKCAKSDFNAPPRTLSTWTRHYMAVVVGDNCPDFEPLPPMQPGQWGCGPEDPRL
jgi:hypothetical protein